MLSKIDIRQMDLNLLPKFRAVYERRSVSQAARDLFVTQSAVSNALAKMRSLFKDELFVRTPEGMLPTALAHAIRDAIEPALGLIEGGLQEAGAFAPQLSQRTFRLAMTQVAHMAVLPHLLQSIAIEAPAVSIEALQAAPTIAAEDLRSGQIDLAIGVPLEGNGAVRTESLASCGLVYIARRSHPALPTISRHEWSACTFIDTDDLCQLRTNPSSRFGGAVSQLKTSDLLSVPLIVAATDLVALVPKWLARMSSGLDLVMVNAQPDVAPYNLYISWHTSRERDRGHTWLRGLLSAAATAASLDETDFRKSPCLTAA